MSTSQDLNNIEALGRKLPFHLNDFRQVNATYARWKQQGTAQDGYDIDLWGYCYIRRYFIVKFIGSPHYSIADLDLLVEQAYTNVQAAEERGGATERYASWVSVICKRVFLNYKGRRHDTISLDASLEQGVEWAQAEIPDDIGSLMTILVLAIKRLPEYLRDVAHLRFVGNHSYEEIAERTGKPLPIIRSYVNRAILRFRQDPQVRHFWGRMQE